jgi:ubiquinone/menaquinone biosynthesis C-methylase UbiE
LAIEIAKSGRYNVTGLDISQSFVHIAAGKAREAGVNVAFRLGNASAMPFADCSFDYVISMAAFKNFSDPVGALNEIFRVLTPGGWASIYDLRKDASMEDIGEEVRNMKLSPVSSVFTRWVFQFSLLKRAYTRDDLVKLVAQSAFRTGEVRMEGIGFELRLKR